MLRTRAPALYGFRTMLYGTLLPAPLIAGGFPDLVRRVEKEGHEVGVHAWDHRLWQDHLDDLSPERIRSELERAFASYEKALGHRPGGTAAPEWYCNAASLSVQDALGLSYCSDTRGRTPFLPTLEETDFRTPQIPTTMPCLEELVGRTGGSGLEDYLSGGLREGEANVFPVHAEVEGNLYADLFKANLQRSLKAGVTFSPLIDLCRNLDPGELPRHRIRHMNIPGRSGVAAVQET
jgi:hypothetical protein